jgi:2-keto-4-pentenoate hydratase
MNLLALAARQLSDYDRHRPGLVFVEQSLPLTLTQAYELQFKVAQLREQRGECLAGYKIGCISRTMQAQLGLDQPVFGHVWESECHASGSVIDTARYDGLAVEGEFAVRLDSDIPSADWLQRNPGALGDGFVIIELHNYVFRAPVAGRAAELVANNAIHAGVVLPVEETTSAAPGASASATLKVVRNGEALGETNGDELEGGLMPGILHLARHLERYDRRLRQGQLILTGSPLPLWRVVAGDRIEVLSEQLGQQVVVRVRGADAERDAAPDRRGM